MKSPVVTDSKKRGEWAEALFITEALRRGWEVFTEHGDSSSYDVIVSKGDIMRTIQVKSTFVVNDKRSVWTVSRGSRKKTPYKDGLDFFALYCHNTGVWYMITPEEIAGKKTFTIQHTNKTKNNWDEVFEDNKNSTAVS